jgi:hypothetical protein
MRFSRAALASLSLVWSSSSLRARRADLEMLPDVGNLDRRSTSLTLAWSRCRPPAMRRRRNPGLTSRMAWFRGSSRSVRSRTTPPPVMRSWNGSINSSPSSATRPLRPSNLGWPSSSTAVAHWGPSTIGRMCPKSLVKPSAVGATGFEPVTSSVSGHARPFARSIAALHGKASALLRSVTEPGTAVRREAAYGIAAHNC